MATKKRATKRKSVKKKRTSSVKRSVPKELPLPVSSNKYKQDDDLLCKISLVFAVFFILSVFSRGIGQWVLSTQWWIWLALSILFGLKPMMRYLKK